MEDANERTISEKRREQNRRAQRRFRERHGKRVYERRRPDTPESTVGAESSNGHSSGGSITDTIVPAQLTMIPTDDMAFSPARDTLSDPMDFSDNDCLTVSQVEANIFALSPTHPQDPSQDLFQTFGNLPEQLPPETESALATIPHLPIHMAVRQSSAKIVYLLLKHGVDVNDPDNEGLSPLMSACIRGDIDIVNTLLDAGAAITCTDTSQQSPLHWAVIRRCEALLKILLKHCKGDTKVLDAFNQDGQTPLHISIQTGFDTAVEALLLAGANASCPVRRQ